MESVKGRVTWFALRDDWGADRFSGIILFVMGEIHRHTPEGTASFMEKIGYPIKSEDILQTYPIYFAERRVFRIVGDGTHGEEVLKVRPDDDKAQQELSKLTTLFASYSYSGAKFPSVEGIHLPDSGHVVFKMSYLGRNLTELGEDLDLVEMGEIENDDDTFEGFSADEIDRLLRELKASHRNFSQNHGLIHGDAIQLGVPNNIVYHRELEKLFFVDAEALGERDSERELRFFDQMRSVEEWIYESLLVTPETE